jgi:hypothetical protein
MTETKARENSSIIQEGIETIYRARPMMHDV